MFLAVDRILTPRRHARSSTDHLAPLPTLPEHRGSIATGEGQAIVTSERRLYQ